MTTILALDTSTNLSSVAVCRDGAPLSELSWMAQGNHSRQLDRLVREVFALAGVTTVELDTIAVAVGPGSFNGVRVGLSYALGVAFGLDAPIVPVPTLDVVAYQAQQDEGTVIASIPAGRGELYFAAYRGRGDRWQRAGEYGREAVERVLDRLDGGDLAAGPGADLLAGEAARSGRRIAVVSPAARLPRAAYLAELSTHGRKPVNARDFGGVRPLYLRPSAAEEKRAAGE